ncbi:MAG: sialidase family protein [Planctomycetota bacterium]
MTRHSMAIVCVAFCIARCSSARAADASASASDLIEFRVPTPPPVGDRKLDVGFEIPAPMGWGSVLETKDGRLMMIGDGRALYSEDGGKTWSGSETLSAPIRYAIRLQSGNLGGLDGKKFYISDDDGKTWTLLCEDVQGGNQGGPYSCTMIETRNGRLLFPTRYTNAAHQGHYDEAGCWGILNGKLVPIEGHAHYPEADIGYLCLSDDGGKHWYRSSGTILIWHQDGYGGMWPCDEPGIMDGRNGDIYMLMRTTLGRVYIARSGQTDYVNRTGERVRHKPGVYFDYPQPLALPGSYSPCTVRLVPETGDWLIVWNQVSGDEIRAGYRRGRLSSAISSDDGKTWKHFRTIDSVVLPTAGPLTPDPSPQMARGLDYVGELPEDFGSVSYPWMSVLGDTVFVTFSRVVVNPRKGDVAGRRMQVRPLSWFYEDESSLPAGPRLIVSVPAMDDRSWNTYDVPSDLYQDRFFVNSRDLQTFLKSPMGRLGFNMYAPLNQVITCLGWTPQYDRSHLDDPDDPRLVVRCTHPGAAPPTEEIVAENPANGDVWAYRSSSRFLGRMTEETSSETYSYSRVGKYDIAQSFALEGPADVTSIEVYLVAQDGCKKGVTLSLCEDDAGKPSEKLIAPDARVTMGAFGGKAFRAFAFAKLVHIDAGVPIWIVLTKEDEEGKNPMYNVPTSGKDSAGAMCDWYPAGSGAERGPYADASKPSDWRIMGGSDAYFRIISKRVVSPGSGT